MLKPFLIFNSLRSKCLVATPTMGILLVENNNTTTCNLDENIWSNWMWYNTYQLRSLAMGGVSDWLFSLGNAD